MVFRLMVKRIFGTVEYYDYNSRAMADSMMVDAMRLPTVEGVKIEEI